MIAATETMRASQDADANGYRGAQTLATDGHAGVTDRQPVSRKINAGNDATPDDSECPLVKPSKAKRRSKTMVPPREQLTGDAASSSVPPTDTEAGVATACRELMELQRRRAAALKSRIMIDNQLAALVAQELGYHAGLEENDRKKLRAEATKLIKSIDAGDEAPPGCEAVIIRVAGIVTNTGIARDGFDAYIKGLEKEMLKLAAKLPVADLILTEEFRGFGLLSLATVIGETGDLSLYANPAKVWKRMGCAPFNGKMPSTWRYGKEGKLSSEEWSAIGYSPRRRSIAFVIGENVVKCNKSVYRERYDSAKASAAEKHPDWPAGRCHYHGMLLATKRLLRDLWCGWNKEVKQP